MRTKVAVCLQAGLAQPVASQDTTVVRSHRQPGATGGRLVGTIVAPRGVRFFLQRGNYIWGVLRGELDENYVVRYRIEST